MVLSIFYAVNILITSGRNVCRIIAQLSLKQVKTLILEFLISESLFLEKDPLNLHSIVLAFFL